MSELSNPFIEFAIILFLATVLGTLGRLLNQPLLVMFIFLGILVGPSVLNIVHSKENVQLLAEVGIAILLLIVGLKLDIRLIKSTGKIALMTGIGQVIITSLFRYFRIDFDPKVVLPMRNQNKNVIYGDLEDPELLDHVPLENAKIFINTIPDREFAIHMMHSLKRKNFKGKIYLTALQQDAISLLKELGAEDVILLHHLAARNFFDEYLQPVIQEN